MRLTIGRRNENDDDSSTPTLLQYINDFVNLTMTDDIKIFEQFGTLQFNIDENVTDGVYTFNSLGVAQQFSNISLEGFVSLADPVDSSISWNRLEIYQDPRVFFDIWGVNNTDILIPGFPTQMLFYGNEFTFRTIPNTEYTIVLFGYKIVPEFDSSGDPALPFDHWLRYIAYGAALNYARDYRFEDQSRARLEKDFAHERKLLLTRTFNQVKLSRALPRF